MKRLPIGILASGRGSNFEAIIGAIEAGRVNAEVRILIANRPEAHVLEVARVHGVPTAVIDHHRFASREDFDAELANVLCAEQTELVALAGFDRLITNALLDAFPARIINVHPALLPAFTGVDAQAQASSYGVTIAGATVHIVDDQVDHGPIIIQAAVPAIPGEDPLLLRNRILAQEHKIYPYAIQLFAEGRVLVTGRSVTIRGVASVREDALISPPLPNAFRIDVASRVRPC